jgi:Flp pilus assembly protein TadG
MRSMRQFLVERSGNIAILYALLLGPMLVLAGGAVDFARRNAVQANLVEALDSAGLAIAQMDAANGPEIRNLTDAARLEYLKDYGRSLFHENFKHEALIENLAVDFDITSRTITPIATGTMKTLILKAAFSTFNPAAAENFASMSLSSDTEITRAATGNTEVALVLDTTGSMALEGRMDDLKAAAREFVDVLIRADQSQFYSKVAIVPYGRAVNLGARAEEARGAVAAPSTITNITRARPAVVTANGHGFQNGERVYITGVSGMTAINNQTYTVANRTANTFELRNASNSSNIDARSYSAYLSGGAAHCTETGCAYKHFINQNSSRRTFAVSTCVSERTGGSRYNDVPPATSKVGYVYVNPDGTNGCPAEPLLPLTRTKATALSTIDALSAGGSTGGHVGVAWGWYAVSPNYRSMFTGDSEPALYSDREVSKSVVIMTDGEYNSSYCDGVISQSSSSGSGSSNDKINCNAPNGHSFDQALALCNSMKDAGVTVYTVGFKIVDDQRARDLMSDCASSPNHRYLAEDGAALKRHFAAIAQAISQLHVSR